jgi:hypothetical protein
MNALRYATRVAPRTLGRSPSLSVINNKAIVGNGECMRTLKKIGTFGTKLRRVRTAP